MALQSFQIDPDATDELTPDEVVAKVNAAATDITRAGSVDPSARPIEAGEITDVELDSAAVTLPKLAGGVAKGNLDAQSDTERGYVRTDPVSGEFPVVSLQRDAAGDLDITYDDVVIP